MEGNDRECHSRLHELEEKCLEDLYLSGQERKTAHDSRVQLDLGHPVARLGKDWNCRGRHLGELVEIGTEIERFCMVFRQLGEGPAHRRKVEVARTIRPFLQQLLSPLQLHQLC